MSFPALDLQHLDLNELDRACCDWGSFLLYGHGIDTALTQEAIAQCLRFFEQSVEVKNQIRRSARNSWGFYDAELTKNRRDWKEIIDIGPAVDDGPLAGSHPQWPELDGFRDCMELLTAEMRAVSLTLVENLALALQSSADLRSPFDDDSSFLRLNYYPQCPEPAPADADFVPAVGELGISHHTDAGAVTTLLQDDQPGLQMHHAGSWHTVQPRSGALVVNIGDIVQVWSNDRYRAPLHRVLANAENSRISLPYFLNPTYEYDYAPLSDGRAASEPPHYRPINWGEFRSKRSAGDYADYGEEIQISNYCIYIQ